MFRKLRNRIIIITMAVTTAILVISGVVIVLFSSTMRPEPKPEPNYNLPNPAAYDDQELKDYIKSDREEGNARLLMTLLMVGVATEVSVFVIVYYLSQKIVEPVEDAYGKQKIFIANASHELKTPLAVIEANIEALDVDKKNEKWRNNIENEINHANKLVLDLLQLAKMDAGKINKSALEEIDLNTEIRKRIKTFEPKFSGKITLKTNKEVTKRMLSRQDFVQVVDILLDNATKYGERKIVVNTDKNSVAISNDGAVVSDDDLEKVFDRFYQVDKTKEGSGLGLAIAKAICEQNGWNICCENVKHLTTFVVDLGRY